MALDVQRITGTDAKVAARLCNFATGRAELLQAHVDFLDKEVAGVIRNMQGPWVDLFGYASRVGDARFNMTLSEQRISSIKQRISRYATLVNFQIQKGFGETQSGPNERDNSGYWRAVEVYVYAHRPPPPKPVPPIASTQFEIRVVGGGSMSAVIQADDYIFQIVDLARSKTAFYFYTGVGVGLSIPKIPGPGSMTYAGPPTKFGTSRSAELHMFNSRAVLSQEPGATIGRLSIDGALGLRMTGVSDFAGRIFTVPITIKIEGGPGIQMPGAGSVTEGVLAMATPVWPFTGY